MSGWLPSFAIEWRRNAWKNAALDLMICARGILDIDDDTVASMLAEGCRGAHGAAPLVGRFENDRS